MPASTIDRLLAAYAQTGQLPAISGGDGTDENNDDSQNQNDDGKNETRKVEFSAEQSQEISRIVAREVKDARAKAAQAERDRIKAEKEAEETERQRRADEEKGEFAKVRQSIESERDQFKTEAERIKGEYEAVAGLFDKQYQAALTDIPDDLKLFQPGDNAGVLERVAFLDKLTEALKKRDTGTTPGNRPNPKPGNGNPTLVSPLSRQQITSA